MEIFDYEKQHLQALRQSLAECTVLLRSNGDFPLEAPGKIAAYGSGVRKTIKGGTGSGEVNSRYFINVEQGLKDAGFTVTTQKWLDAYDETYTEARKAFRARMKAEAKAQKTLAVLYAMGKAMPEPEYDLPLDGEGDTAIYVLSRISGEGNDRDPIPGDIRLSATEKRDILALNEKYEKFMLVINAGGAVDLSELDAVENILVLSQLGVETGAALADILLGRQNPSGKLATTWSKWEDYFPMEDFGDHNDTRYREGIYVGYRYFDSVGRKALFPFGYGRSFTTFSMGDAAVTAEGGQITVTVPVTNTGARPGKEVVQVYVSCPQGKLDKAYQDLAGFAKTALLAPGATEEARVVFHMKDLASYDEETSRWILEKGNYLIRVGSSSVDTKIAAMAVLSGTVTVLQVRGGMGKADFTDWKPEKEISTAVDSTVPVLVLDGAALSGGAVAYDPEYPIDGAVEALTDEQLVYAAIGEFSGSLSVIGEASHQVAGAAGESTSKAPGIPAMVMADGPAGVRVSQQFYRDAKGAHAVGQSGLP
ncbi:MAG: glycoside hydrolase family 3 C-terminal domain-containing protein, partial [Clostridia bacterium]|nr:glycoside hydrolase family 3 C-terminal domain-containing protein [Clostridia bacterium]